MASRFTHLSFPKKKAILGVHERSVDGFVQHFVEFIFIFIFFGKANVTFGVATAKRVVLLTSSHWIKSI